MRNFPLSILLSLSLPFNTAIARTQATSETIDTIPEVVVTGTKNASSIHLIPGSISVVHSSALQSDKTFSLLESVAEHVPGVSMTKNLPLGYGISENAAGQPSIRGLSSKEGRVLVLVDGNPQYTGIFAHPISDCFTSSSTEKVEVIRGSSSVLYGSNAMGGVINIITKENPQGLTISQQVRYGSFNTFRNASGIGYGGDKLNISLTYNLGQSDGHRDSSNLSINNLGFQAAYQINTHWKISTRFDVTDVQGWLPGSQINPTSKADAMALTRNHFNASIQNNYQHVQGAIRTYYFDGVHQLSNWFSRDYTTGFSLHESISLSPSTNITLGTDFKQYGGRSAYKDALIQINELAGYLLLNQEVGKQLHLTAGIRNEENNMYGNRWIPSIGGAWHYQAAGTIKMGLSKGYRSPSIRELYYFPPANETLNPEILWNTDISFINQLWNQALSTEITLYYMEGSNMIQTIPNTQSFPRFINTNSGEIRHYGLEFSGQLHVNQQLNSLFTYTWLQQDERSPFSATHTLRMHPEFTIKKWTASFSVSALLDYSNNPNELTARTSIINTDFGLRYNASKHLACAASLHNLLNQRHSYIAGFPAPGIHGNLSIRYLFYHTKDKQELRD